MEQWHWALGLYTGLQGPMLASRRWGYSGKKLWGCIVLSFDDDYYYYYTSWSGHMFLFSSVSACSSEELMQTIKTERRGRKAAKARWANTENELKKKRCLQEKDGVGWMERGGWRQIEKQKGWIHRGRDGQSAEDGGGMEEGMEGGMWQMGRAWPELGGSGEVGITGWENTQTHTLTASVRARAPVHSSRARSPPSGVFFMSFLVSRKRRPYDK